MEFRGVTKRTALARALALYSYQPAAARAAIVRLDDGRYAVRRVVPWAAMASIPMPDRRPDHALLVGARGVERAE